MSVGTIANITVESSAGLIKSDHGIVVFCEDALENVAMHQLHKGDTVHYSANRGIAGVLIADVVEVVD